MDEYYCDWAYEEVEDYEWESESDEDVEDV